VERLARVQVRILDQVQNPGHLIRALELDAEVAVDLQETLGAAYARTCRLW